MKETKENRDIECSKMPSNKTVDGHLSNTNKIPANMTSLDQAAMNAKNRIQCDNDRPMGMQPSPYNWEARSKDYDVINRSIRHGRRGGRTFKQGDGVC